MIIQCEQCRTKFRLDDSKVKGKGVKVRCAKCKHVFTVANGQPEEAQPDFGAMLEQSVEAAPQGSTPVSFALEDDTAAPASTDFSFDAASFGAVEKEEPAAAVDTSTFDLGSEQPAAPADFSFDTSAIATEASTAPAAAVDTSAFDLGSEHSTEPVDFSFDTSAIDTEAPTAPAAAVDTSAFEFGAEQTAAPSDFSFDTASLAAEEPSASTAADTASFELPKDEPHAETPGGGDFDLSALAWNDDLSAQPEAAAGEADKTMVSSSFFSDVEDMTMVQSPAAPVKLDLDDFADSIQTRPEDDKTADADKADQSSEFNINEIDFGDALNVDGSHNINPEKLSREHELFFAALDEGGEGNSAHADTAEQKPAEEVPPLPITSRRKQSPAMVAMMVAALLAVAAVVGYFGFSMFMSEEKPKEAQGRININAVSAYYIKNKAAGDMLVISGDAVNAFDAPRASIQVKAVIYGAAGQPLATKQVFAGNPLGKEQLATMPVEKIEAAMANQFGDSLANMEVLPGKAIPFMVVITNLPADAKDYGIEVAGSTVSTGKK